MILGSSLLYSCRQSEIEAPGPIDDFKFIQPTNFPEANYTFENNPVSKEGFELGKKLFFDPVLSGDNSISCSSCHHQSVAFADSPIHPLSVGINDQLGTRNAPPLMNLAFMDEFLWDGGIRHLDFVAVNAITAEFEMGETMENVVRKINQIPDYRKRFQRTFNTEVATGAYLQQALSQFMVMMVSSNSKYDKFIRNEGETLTEIEMEGLNIFRSKCSGCHSGELFSDFEFRNNGLPGNNADLGRAIISQDNTDSAKFRTPSLRNIARTAPYMHNARFETLRAVLDHYDEGVIDNASLANELRSNKRLGIEISEDEKDKIIAFLETLTDFDFIQDPKFKNLN